MKKIIVSVLLLVSLHAHSQLITDSVLIEQHYRTFNYNSPASDIKGGSLMFVMHGSGGNSIEVMKHAVKLEAVSAKDKLLVVYPNGYQHYWNECRKYSNASANKENINEEAFFTAMINYFKKKYSINTAKVFAAGFSGGGQMSYKLAMTMPAKIKAIAAVVGASIFGTKLSLVSSTVESSNSTATNSLVTVSCGIVSINEEG